MRLTDIAIKSFTEAKLEELKELHTEKAVAAAIEHIKRQQRLVDPDGAFDDQGRFYVQEGCSCCDDIRAPSKAYPYSQMVHARTLPHCTELHGADFNRAKEALRGIKRIAKAEGWHTK